MKHGTLILFWAAFLCGCGAKEEDEKAKPIVEVKVAKVEEREVADSVRAPATIFAREQANIASKLTSTVRELIARKGDSVSAGQVLALLERADLQAQKSEAESAVTDAEATLAKLSTGTLPTDVERARGQLATAEAALNQAQKFYERRKNLFDQGAIPQRDLLMSQTELAQAKTGHDVAARSLQLLETQSNERDIQVARSRVEQARARVKLAEAQLSYTEIRSPFAGTITEQFLFPGDMAKPDTPVFTLADVASVVARAQVPEPQAQAIRAGQGCAFAPGDQTEQTSPGKISVVNKAVDLARRTVEIWCEIANGQSKLRVGAYGSVAVNTGAPRKMAAVPLAAVQLEEGTAKGFVMIVDTNQKAVKREVETAPAIDGMIPVTKGLKAGEVVITEAGYGMPEGTQVKVAAPEKPGAEKQ